MWFQILASKIDRKVLTEKPPVKSVEKTVEYPAKKTNGKTPEKSDDPAEKSMGANSSTGGQSGGKAPISAEQLPTANKDFKQETKPKPR